MGIPSSPTFLEVQRGDSILVDDLKGQVYYLLSEDDCICGDVWKGSDLDIERWKEGNVFSSYTAAEAVLASRTPSKSKSVNWEYFRKERDEQLHAQFKNLDSMSELDHLRITVAYEMGFYRGLHWPNPVP